MTNTRKLSKLTPDTLTLDQAGGWKDVLSLWPLCLPGSCRARQKDGTDLRMHKAGVEFRGARKMWPNFFF